MAVLLCCLLSMLSVANKPFLLTVFMQNVITQNVVAP
jgi:hypothetical protein